MAGAPDRAIFDACVREGRCLVTLDLDFADVLSFPPNRAAGIAVLRLTARPSLTLLRTMVRNLLAAACSQPLTRRLWIVEPGRIRIHESTSETEG